MNFESFILSIIFVIVFILSFSAFSGGVAPFVDNIISSNADGLTKWFFKLLVPIFFVFGIGFIMWRYNQ